LDVQCLLEGIVFILRSIFCFLFLLCSTLSAQLKGKVMDSLNNPLSGVSIFIQNSFVGTVTNEEGEFYLGNLPEKKGEIVFKSLGYETQKHPFDVQKMPLDYKVQLREAFISLKEVTLKSDENPANAIIRAAINKRKEKLLKNQSFTPTFIQKGW